MARIVEFGNRAIKGVAAGAPPLSAGENRKRQSLYRAKIGAKIGAKIESNIHKSLQVLSQTVTVGVT